MVKVNKKTGTLEEEVLPWRQEPTEKEMIPCEGRELFNKLLDLYKRAMVFQNPIEYLLNTIWILHTYHMDKWDSTPYLGFFGAGNEKGKSRALSLLSMLSYRGCAIALGTDAGFRKCLTEGGTLIVDQAENLFFKKNDKTFMYNVFTSGYTRDFRYVQLDPEDKKEFDCKEVFGAKAYCMQEDGILDNPIRQRTLPFYMIHGVPQIKSLRRSVGVMEEIDTIFKMAHWMRIQKHKSLDYNTELFGRTGELIDPFLLTIPLYDIPYWVEKKLYTHAFEMADEKRDIANDTLPAEVYYAIPSVLKTTPMFTASHIKSYLLQNFNEKYDDKKLDVRQIGKNLHLMGLKTVKIGGSYVYDFTNPHNIQILDGLKNQYDIDNSIQTLCIKYESEHDIIPNTIKSVYERYADYMEYKSMQELARQIHENAVTVPIIIPEFEPDFEEPEIEYNCPSCGTLVIGTNPNIICSKCESIQEDDDST